MGSGVRVWLNAIALQPQGSGVQTYIRQLIAALATCAGMSLTARVQRNAVDEMPLGVARDVRPVSKGACRAVHALWPVRGVDLVHGLDVDLPLALGQPSVATVHDLSVFDTPWAYPGHRAVAERALVRRTLNRADAIIAVSQFTADRVRLLSGRDAVVTHLAPGPWARPPSPEEVERVRSRYRLPAAFALQLGNVEPRKDILCLAKACNLSGVPLVLAGAGSRGHRAPASAIGLGYVPQEDVPGLYGAATVVCYLSHYEGFGLPPLEAMACGAPVMASRIAPLAEVLGSAAVLVRNGDVEGVSRLLRDLVRDDDRRVAMATAGVRHAASFDWANTASATVGVYDSLRSVSRSRHEG